MEIDQRKSTLSNKIYVFSKTRGTVSGKFMMIATLLGQRAYCNVEHLKQTSRKDSAPFNPETGTLQIMAAVLFEAWKTGVPDEEGRLPVAQTYNHPGTGAVSRKRLPQSSSIMTQNMLKKTPRLTIIEFCNWYLVLYPEKVKDVRIAFIQTPQPQNIYLQCLLSSSLTPSLAKVPPHRRRRNPRRATTHPRSGLRSRELENGNRSSQALRLGPPARKDAQRRRRHSAGDTALGGTV